VFTPRFLRPKAEEKEGGPRSVEWAGWRSFADLWFPSSLQHHTRRPEARHHESGVPQARCCAAQGSRRAHRPRQQARCPAGTSDDITAGAGCMLYRSSSAKTGNSRRRPGSAWPTARGRHASSSRRVRDQFGHWRRRATRGAGQQLLDLHRSNSRRAFPAAPARKQRNLAQERRSASCGCRAGQAFADCTLPRPSGGGENVFFFSSRSDSAAGSATAGSDRASPGGLADVCAAMILNVAQRAGKDRARQKPGSRAMLADLVQARSAAAGTHYRTGRASAYDRSS